MPRSIRLWLASLLALATFAVSADAATLLHRKQGDQFFDSSGNPLAGGKLYFDQAGTSNDQATYSNSAGTTPNANPIVLDSAGRLTVPVYFGDSSSVSNYKETLTTSANVTVSPWPFDNIPAATPEASAATFASPLFPWTQVTNAASPVALTAADAGKAYEADTTSGNIEFDLPSAASVGDGKGFVFKKTASAAAMIIDPNGSETVDNSSASIVIAGKDELIGIFSNGAEWYIAFRFGGTPSGAVMAWTTGTPPDGWLECNGSAISRTTYAALFAVIGDDYGVGDGSTTFNLPDLRGEFIRGWDHGKGSDPNAASRTSRGDGTTGDNVGTKQADEFELHGHPVRIDLANDNTTNVLGGFTLEVTGPPSNYPAFTGTPTDTAGQQIGGTGGSETRPRNVNMMYIIKL